MHLQSEISSMSKLCSNCHQFIPLSNFQRHVLVHMESHLCRVCFKVIKDRYRFKIHEMDHKRRQIPPKIVIHASKSDQNCDFGQIIRDSNKQNGVSSWMIKCSDGSILAQGGAENFSRFSEGSKNQNGDSKSDKNDEKGDFEDGASAFKNGKITRRNSNKTISMKIVKNHSGFQIVEKNSAPKIETGDCKRQISSKIKKKLAKNIDSSYEIDDETNSDTEEESDSDYEVNFTTQKKVKFGDLKRENSEKKNEDGNLKNIVPKEQRIRIEKTCENEEIEVTEELKDSRRIKKNISDTVKKASNSVMYECDVCSATYKRAFHLTNHKLATEHY